MKRFSTTVILCFLLFGSTTHSFGQKKDPKIASGKNLRNTILTMMRTAKETKGGSTTCDPSGILKSIPRKKMVASKEDLAKEIGKIVDSFTPPMSIRHKAHIFHAMDYFNEVKKMTEYVSKIEGEDYGLIPPSRRKIIEGYYFRLKRAKKKGFNLKKVSFKHKKCTVTVVTNLTPTKWKRGYKANDFVMGMEWKITSEVTIECPCLNKGNTEVKKAVYSYAGKTDGPMRIDDYDVDLNKRARYGLRFGKLLSPTLGLLELKCCPQKTNPPQDGSYVAPDEDINNEHNFIDTTLGISFGEGEETEMIGSVAALFNITSLGNNPLFLGPKATVNTTALNGNEIKATRVLIGPTAEYQIPVGVGSTKIITGLNTGYSFGAIDAFGFKQKSSGFAANAYGGVEIGLTKNLALGIILNLFEYNNFTFKADEGDFETTSSNSVFISDRPNISVGLRIDLNNN